MIKYNPAVILGGHVNGLGTIYSIRKCDANIPIVLVDKIASTRVRPLSYYSCYVNEKVLFKSSEELLKALYKIYRKYHSKLVLYPTGNDYYAKILFENYDQLITFCHIPINRCNIENIMNKGFQYSIAEKLNIPIPKHVTFTSKNYIEKINDLEFPIIIKALTRNKFDQKFRFKVLRNNNDATTFIKDIETADVTAFQASEIIPGPSSQLFTYGSYFHYGKAKGEFVGRKITQQPYKYGVVCIAENKFQEQTQLQGRKLLEHLDFHGISQVEFKYDIRDQRYKLLEINPRSWMWVKLATESGVNLPIIQYQCMTELPVLNSIPKQSREIKYYYDLSSIFRKLVNRHPYDLLFLLKHLGINNTVPATIAFHDLKPSLMFGVLTIYQLFVRALAKLRARVLS